MLVLATMPAIAEAQFFYRLHVNSIGATTCTTTSAVTVVNGDLDWILPPTDPKLRFSQWVNANPAQVSFSQTVPFNFDHFPVASLNLNLSAAVPLPYIAAAEFMPMANGNPIGTGFVAIWTCDASGGGTLSLLQVAAPPPPIPATSAHGLMMLTTLLALAGMALARRRAPRRPIA